MEIQINGIAERKIRSHSWQRHTWQKLLKYKIRVHILHVFALKIHSHTRTYVVYVYTMLRAYVELQATAVRCVEAKTTTNKSIRPNKHKKTYIKEYL